jgi:hypothetical protein
MLILLSFLPLGRNASAQKLPAKKQGDETVCTLYRALNGSPAENISKVMELMGGIEQFIGEDDVVVVKPNVQWWNQGASNLSAFKRLVELIMSRPGGFSGEVVLAENCHRGTSPWKHAGWSHEFSRNSDLNGIRNYNDLSEIMKKKYGNRFSICHWVDVEAGGKRIYNLSDGTGYVYCDGTSGVPLISCDNGLKNNDYRATIMSYPVFNTDKGTIIDFKDGIRENGKLTNQPLRFINFAVLNHHSTHCGATSAIKNYLGISDISGGPDPLDGGKLTEQFYNFHSFPFDKWKAGPVPGMIGFEVAEFMNTIRKADLNITTAEWVGLASRTETPVARTRAVLAGTDPVALDYHATKYILYPNSKCSIHNPDDPESPLHQYLLKCAEHGGGEFDESEVAVKSYDFNKGGFQNNDELVVNGERVWGTNPKMILKYLVLRSGLMS